MWDAEVTLWRHLVVEDEEAERLAAVIAKATGQSVSSGCDGGELRELGRADSEAAGQGSGEFSKNRRYELWRTKLRR